MNDHPYIVSKVTQSKYQVENSKTGEVYMTCATEDIALTIVHLMAKAFQEGNLQGFDGGFDAGTKRACKLVDACNIGDLAKGESDSARAPSGASKHAKRVAKDRKRTEGGV